jgi:predicted NBD/HSP70 family sugar kinase
MARFPEANPASWPVLGGGERNALRELVIGGPQSRAEIARRLGISRTSLTRSSRTLIEQGFVTEGAVELRGTTGRPSELLHLRPESRTMLGIKLTGDRLYSVVTDLQATVLASHDEPLVSKAVEDVVEQIAGVCERFRTAHPNIAAAGIGLAGDVATAGGRQIVVDSPFLGWSDVAFADLVSRRLGILVETENDVRSLTAAEHWFGVGAGYRSMALVTVGYGLGFGLVVGGELVTGAHGRAARLDHLMIDPGGPRCGSGHRGCASMYLTDWGIVSALRTPGLTYQDALALARGGDPAAQRAFADAGNALGILVATLANTIDPEKIVVTGEGIAVAELARTEIDAAIEAHRHPTGAPIDLDVQPFAFEEWARAGAALAIRAGLQV